MSSSIVLDDVCFSGYVIEQEEELSFPVEILLTTPSVMRAYCIHTACHSADFFILNTAVRITKERKEE